MSVQNSIINLLIAKNCEGFIIGILSQDEEKQSDLFLVKQILKDVLPEAEERISWSMPTYWKNHNILHFAASKNHIGFYPGPEAVEEFREELKIYNVSKGTVRIPYGKVDKELIGKIAGGAGEQEIMLKECAGNLYE